jgi:putative redox-active protein with C_GCAxxG_C_C motif
MQTLLDASDTEALSLVKLTAGLPGGIGNTGGECGGITAPLIFLGLRHAHDPPRDGVPAVVEKGHDYLRRFTAFHGTALCREIRGDSRLPLRCIGVIQRAAMFCAEPVSAGTTPVLSAERRTACAHLCAHWNQRQFHCAHAVFLQLTDVLPVTQQLLDGTSAFIGGTVCSGGTCSALTAGVMALGLRLGEVERSRLRVLRMIGTMAVGGDAFTDDLNAFNKSMNRGHQLARWFSDRFGGTQCRALTQSDFATPADVERYIEGDGVGRCMTIARCVADEVRRTVRSVRGFSTYRRCSSATRR